MVVPDQCRVVELNSLVEELAFVHPVRLEFHAHHFGGHFLGHAWTLLCCFTSPRSSSFTVNFGEVCIEPGADSCDVLVVGNDGKRPVQLGKQVHLRQKCLAAADEVGIVGKAVK